MTSHTTFPERRHRRCRFDAGGVGAADPLFLDFDPVLPWWPEGAGWGEAREWNGASSPVPRWEETDARATGAAGDPPL